MLEAGGLRKVIDAVHRRIMHPFVSFGGNLTFIIGAALFVASVIGGGLRVLTGFPTVWLVLAATGAFLMTSGALVTFVPGVRRKVPPTPPPVVVVHDRVEEEERKARAEQQRAKEAAESAGRLALRRAVRHVREELRFNQAGLQRVREEVEDVLPPLSTQQWRVHEAILLDHADARPHVAASEAYRCIDRFIAMQMWETPVGTIESRDVAPSRRDVAIAIDAITTAVEALSTAEQDAEF